MNPLPFVLIVLLSLNTGCAWLDQNEEDETRDWSANKLYDSGKAAMAKGDYPGAIDYFTKLENRYPFGRFAQQALLETAYAHYKNEEPELAIAAAERFIKLYPGNPNADYAFYLKGLTNFSRDFGFVQRYIPTDRGQRNQASAMRAFNDFSTLIQRYPNSKYAADARQRMIYLKNNIAQYEVHVGRYYIKRGAYLAAANRGKTVVQNFPNTNAVPNALAIMLISYTLLDLPKLADDTRSILELNYPDHLVLSKPISAQSDTGGKPTKWYRFWE